jgi:putative ABC transport system permease protein
LYVSPVDNNFFSFFNIGIMAGHNFTRDSRDSLHEEYIINETALHYLGYKDPSEVIGREFKPIFGIDGIFKGGTIVGVVKDFCYSTMKTRIKPLVFFQKPIWYWNFLVKIDSASTGEGVRYLKSVWDKVYPEYTFDYSFNDQSYDAAYKKEITQAKITNVFMVLAIIIATLGLYGLASISTEQRTKEIGIRKVVGAASKDIVFLLNREFTIWVGISVAIALPVAWYLMDRWSSAYAYHAALSWWIFALAGFSVILVAWITISYRTVRASLKNPVEVLRQE